MTKSDIQVYESDELVNLLKELDLMQGCKLILDALLVWATHVIDPSSSTIPEKILTYTLSTFPEHFHSTIRNEWNARRHWENLIVQFSRRMDAMNITIPEHEKPIRWKYNEHAVATQELLRRSNIIADCMSRLTIEDAMNLMETVVREWAIHHDLDELRQHVADYSYKNPNLADQPNKEWTEAGISGYIPFLLANMSEH